MGRAVWGHLRSSVLNKLCLRCPFAAPTEAVRRAAGDMNFRVRVGSGGGDAHVGIVRGDAGLRGRTF